MNNSGGALVFSYYKRRPHRPADLPSPTTMRRGPVFFVLLKRLQASLFSSKQGDDPECTSTPVHQFGISTRHRQRCNVARTRPEPASRHYFFSVFLEGRIQRLRAHHSLVIRVLLAPTTMYHTTPNFKVSELFESQETSSL